MASTLRGKLRASRRRAAGAKHGIDSRALLAGGLLAALLAGCGSGGEPAQTTAPALTGGDAAVADDAEAGLALAEDEGAVRRTIEKVLEGTDPKTVCEKLLTPRYVRREHDGPDGCEADRAKLKPAASAKAQDVVISQKSAAQALVTPKGGSHGGDRLRAELVLDGMVWRLDSLRRNVPVGP